MALHLSTDFNLQEWVTAVLPILRAKNLLLLEGAERGGNIEAPELTYFSQQQVARVGTVTTAAAADATSIVVNEDFAKRLTAGYLLMIGEEVLNVTAVNLTNNTLTV
jgi:cadmium resistance protein CadD (predicted permease)